MISAEKEQSRVREKIRLKIDPKIGSSVTPAHAGIQNVAHERTALSGFRPAPE